MTQYDVVVGVDVGKSFHWLHAVNQAGDTIFSRRVEQDERKLDAVFAKLKAQADRMLVVVDQSKNIGALTLACAVRAGCDVGYLPGLAMRRASGMLPGDAKTDQRDAQVIARTARSMPEALRRVDTSRDRADMDVLLAYDQDCLVDKTRHINRLHALLSEVNPAFEKAVFGNLDSPFVLALLLRFGGPWGMRRAGKTSVKRWAARQSRVPKDILDAALQAAWQMEHEPAGASYCEQLAIPAAAARIRELVAAREANKTRINKMLNDNLTYHLLMTMPGVGVGTAGAVVTKVDIRLFPDDEKLASYAGIAPRTRQSGTSIKGEAAARFGNKTLKNALYLSAFASLACDPRARAFYDKKRAAGKNHSTALLALARKRLKVMYAIMRDCVPYQS